LTALPRYWVLPYQFRQTLLAEVPFK